MSFIYQGRLPDYQAEHLARLMAAACTERGRGWSAAELAELATQPGVSIAVREEGFGAIRTVGEEAEILTLVVAPEAQGRGIGRALLSSLAFSLNRQVTRITLEVAESNAAARRLYALAGFIEVGRRPGYVRRADGTREDALLLAFELG